MKMKNLVALALAGLCLFSFTGCAKKEEAPAAPAATQETAVADLAYVQDQGKIIVGITDFAPMDYKEKGSDKWIGFDADLANLFAEELGIKAEFLEIDWDNKFLELDSKSIDCIWNGMTITDEVTNNSSPSKAYAKNGQIVVMKADRVGEFTTEDSLKDLSFAAEKGSAGAKEISSRKWDVVEVGAQSDALMEVKAGNVDACVIDSTMAAAMTGEGTDYADLASGVELSTEEYGISFRKGSDLVAKINEFLDAKKADGTLDELAKKYEILLAE